jgi:hypothetical protein
VLPCQFHAVYSSPVLVLIQRMVRIHLSMVIECRISHSGISGAGLLHQDVCLNRLHRRCMHRLVTCVYQEASYGQTVLSWSKLSALRILQGRIQTHLLAVALEMQRDQAYYSAQSCPAHSCPEIENTINSYCFGKPVRARCKLKIASRAACDA